MALEGLSDNSAAAERVSVSGLGSEWWTKVPKDKSARERRGPLFGALALEG